MSRKSSESLGDTSKMDGLPQVWSHDEAAGLYQGTYIFG